MQIDFQEPVTELELKSVELIPVISELEKILHDTRISISTEEDVLYDIIKDKQVIVVAGAFFGDEGKGKTVAGVIKHPEEEIVARVNSGSNAGHTVFYNGKKYVFHLAPSGIFEGKISIIDNNCVMDPVSFIKDELFELIKDKIDYSNLFVGNLGIITPYHKIMDALGAPNSSTLKGMSPVHSAKVRKKMLRLNDLFSSKNHQKKLFGKDLKVYNAMLKDENFNEVDLVKKFENMNSDGNTRIPDHLIDFLKAKDKEEFLFNLYQDYVVNNLEFPKITNTNKMIQDALKRGKKVLLEGPQSYWLSNMIDTFFKSTTSADTTAAGIMAAANYNISKYPSVVINVHKTPASSRVGLGANPAGYVPQDFFSKRNIDSLEKLKGICEDFIAIQKQFFDSIGKNGILKMTDYVDKDGSKYPIAAAMAIASAKFYGEKGATTFKPRITGLFDCVLHKNVNEAQGPYLTISALDRADNTDKIGLVVAYVVSNPNNLKLEAYGKTYNHGDIIRPGDTLPDENVLYHCQPIIKVMDSWKDNPIAAEKRNKNDPLPKQVIDFISEIEYHTGAEVISIGNGPETDNLIYLKKEIKKEINK